MPWVNEVPAIVQGWFLGSEAGTALASVLLGDANPSGKLPFTFPARLEDVGAHTLGEYPGNKEELAHSKNNGDTINEIYREDIFVSLGRQRKDQTAFPVRTRIELYYFRLRETFG